ncbi:MAG: DUF4286 family protein [Pyrinomonadaceae bacterium]|nr:DUF4286 family protein [Acidobacteriota bacterium]MBK7934858.1 DUF4286 family protein [Acidobacteriota bacterium]MBP7375175.1 DUF4286 family protein [Pyrinomonadaceae bacterium]
MLIYEVTAVVDESIADEYEKYMREQHIPDLLATNYFAAAFFAKNGNMYRIGYHCDSREDLEAYFANHAGRLRADMAAHFPSGIEFSRNELEIIALFPEP